MTRLPEYLTTSLSSVLRAATRGMVTSRCSFCCVGVKAGSTKVLGTRAAMNAACACSAWVVDPNVASTRRGLFFVAGNSLTAALTPGGKVCLMLLTL